MITVGFHDDFGMATLMRPQKMLENAERLRAKASKELRDKGPTPEYFALIAGARALTDLSQRSETNGA